MPIRQYFLWVGSILFAALFVASGLLPEPVAHPRSEIPPNQRVNLQIRSNHKWPERVVLDTVHSGRAVAESYPERNLAQQQDVAVMGQLGLPDAQTEAAPAQAPPATNDKASAIPAKPGPGTFRMTGSIRVD
jgi:hypothetical protein